MIKKLNEAAIVNELKGNSAFFRRPLSPPQETPMKKTQVDLLTQPEKSAVSAAVAPPERSITEQPPSPQPHAGSPLPVRPYGSTPGRTDVRPDGRTDGKRTITRYAFEFFQDQIESLRQFSLSEKLRGEKGSMSEMVREAVDMYLAKRNNQEAE